MCPGVMCVPVGVCARVRAGGRGRRVLGRIYLLFRQSPREDMKFKKKINSHSTCTDRSRDKQGEGKQFFSGNISVAKLTTRN